MLVLYRIFAGLKMAVDYGLLEKTLIKADAEYDAAECHGAICGLICAMGAGGALDICLRQTFPDADRGNVLVQEATGMVTDLFRETAQAMDDPECDFSPLLPDDEADMDLRIQMLGQWCQGLLLGLHNGGVSDFSSLDGDAAEILKDMAELARADMYAAEGSEQDEKAYVELVEFVRTATLLLYEEMQPLPAADDMDNNQRLH